MSANPEFIPIFWVIVGAFGYVLVLYKAVSSAPWGRIRDPRDLNVLLCAIIGVLIIWTMKAGLSTSLNLHLLGATLLTLMFGWAFAVLGMSLVVVSITIIQGWSWAILPLNALLLAVLPVLISCRIYKFTEWRLPKNFFVYIFVCAFFGSALTVAMVIFATTITHYLSGSFSMEFLQYNYFRYGLLIMFPEAFLTGMLMSIFVVYRPQWVSTFDDQLYLRNQ